MLSATYWEYDWVLLCSFVKMGINTHPCIAAVMLLELNDTIYVMWLGLLICINCSVNGSYHDCSYHDCSHELFNLLYTFGHEDHWRFGPPKSTQGCHWNISKLAPYWSEVTNDIGFTSYIILCNIPEAIPTLSLPRGKNSHPKTDIDKGILTIREEEKFNFSIMNSFKVFLSCAQRDKSIYWQCPTNILTLKRKALKYWFMRHHVHQCNKYTFGFTEASGLKGNPFQPQNVKSHDQQCFPALHCEKEHRGFCTTQRLGRNCVLLYFVAQGLWQHWTMKESQQRQALQLQHNLRTTLILLHHEPRAQQGVFTSSHLAPSSR